MILQKLKVLLILLLILIPFIGIKVSGNEVLEQKVLAYEKMSLNNRHGNSFVNSVFKDNILLNMAYLRSEVSKKSDIDWEKIRRPFKYQFVLNPNDTFAFHEDVMPKYKNTLVKTSNASFNFDDGFRFSGNLMGDGVCHLASLIYKASKKAGLNSYVPTNHNFAQIPEISPEFGVSIYKTPGNIYGNAMQNLYITNDKENPVIFEFDYKNDELRISVAETNKLISKEH